MNKNTDELSFTRDHPFPSDAVSREALRMERLEEMNLRAYRISQRWDRSMRCQEGDHGCRNTGATCLCRCHDVLGS